jgi:hypothetical protein
MQNELSAKGRADKQVLLAFDLNGCIRDIAFPDSFQQIRPEVGR